MSAAKTDPLPDPSKRDFLYITTGTVGAVGAASFVWPLVDQMNPDASTDGARARKPDSIIVEASKPDDTHGCPPVGRGSGVV